MLHGEAAPKLFETWLPEYAEKVLYLAKQDNKLPSLTVEDMTLGKLKLTFCVFKGSGIPFLLVTFVCMLRRKYLFIYLLLYSHFIFHTDTDT